MALLALTGLAAYGMLYNPTKEKLKPNPTRDWSDIYALYTGEKVKGLLRQKYPDPSHYGMRGDINHQYGYIPKVLATDLNIMDWTNPKSSLFHNKAFWAKYKDMKFQHEVMNNGWGIQIFKQPIYTGDQCQFGPQISSRTVLPPVSFSKERIKTANLPLAK